MKLRMLPSFLVPFFALWVGTAGLAGCSLISGAKPSVVISSPPSGSKYHKGNEVAAHSITV